MSFFLWRFNYVAGNSNFQSKCAPVWITCHGSKDNEYNLKTGSFPEKIMISDISYF
jgi:hypothetical protein